MTANTNKIMLYPEESFEGQPKTLLTDTKELAKIQFRHVAKSLKVTGDPWVVYTKTNYKGNSRMFAEGSYNTLPDGISGESDSLRVVVGGDNDPTILVYPQPNFNGPPISLKSATPDLLASGLSTVSSHLVLKGAWELYTMDNYGDHMYPITIIGDKVPNYEGAHVASLRPCISAPK